MVFFEKHRGLGVNKLYLSVNCLKRFLLPSIIISPSGYLSTVRKKAKKEKGDYTSTHVHTCKNAHFTDTNNCTLLTEKKKSFLKTLLTELELHNSSVGGFFFFFYESEVGDHFITHP